MSEEARSRANTIPMELWRQWYEATSEMWANLPGDNEEARADPAGVYRQWLDSLQNAQRKALEAPVGSTNLYETWRQWMEATTETWRRSTEAGTRMMRLASPRWTEMAQEIQKQMLDEGNLPADPLDFYTRWYNATSGPLSELADDILRDEAFLDTSKRFLDYYTVFDSIFRRVSEEYFGNLRLPTSSDIDRMAGLIVALDDKVDRVEETLEEFEDGYEEPATAGSIDALAERLERVASRLDQLDRVESKLDQLLAAQNTTAGDGQ